ncbi:hypothetical protein D3C85_1697660 [compost metagenome]
MRDPRTKLPLAADGEKKPKTGYWLRRLRDGSVLLAEKPAKQSKHAEVSDGANS